MNNEQYLSVSYFACAVVSVALGLVAYFYLRRSFCALADSASGERFSTMLKRLFPFGLVLPALLGFFSVSYASCDRTTYEKIVQSRRYLVEKNQEQLSSTLFSLVVAILFWDLLLILVQKYSQCGSRRS